MSTQSTQQTTVSSYRSRNPIQSKRLLNEEESTETFAEQSQRLNIERTQRQTLGLSESMAPNFREYVDIVLKHRGLDTAITNCVLPPNLKPYEKKLLVRLIRSCVGSGFTFPVLGQQSSGKFSKRAEKARYEAKRDAYWQSGQGQCPCYETQTLGLWVLKTSSLWAVRTVRARVIEKFQTLELSGFIKVSDVIQSRIRDEKTYYYTALELFCEFEQLEGFTQLLQECGCCMLPCQVSMPSKTYMEFQKIMTGFRGYKVGIGQAPKLLNPQLPATNPIRENHKTLGHSGPLYSDRSTQFTKIVSQAMSSETAMNMMIALIHAQAVTKQSQELRDQDTDALNMAQKARDEAQSAKEWREQVTGYLKSAGVDISLDAKDFETLWLMLDGAKAEAKDAQDGLKLYGHVENDVMSRRELPVGFYSLTEGECEV